MPTTIDWLYHRKSCTTCQRAQAFREGAGTTVTQTVDANKTRIGPADALKLLAGVTRVVAMRGKKVVAFDLADGGPGDETLLAHLIGPTGNLRAPTARVGPTLIVGFNEDAYRELLGES